jgi:RNA polymerase sigma-70 factor (ECF subfamily)
MSSGGAAGLYTKMAITTERDEETFRRLVEPHRRGLHAHCYRMLGSLHDAEDAHQDALLRAWRSLPKLREGSSLRAWLYTIATNVCLDAIARRPKRVLPAGHGPPALAAGDVGEAVAEPIWLEPYPDDELEDGDAAPEARYEQREAVELAFVAALQHLPAQQRAVLILREVLGFSARETSESLDTTVPAVNSALQRARKAVEERLPERSQQATLRALGDAESRALLQRYVDAWQENDVDAIVALLAHDATMQMPPWPGWFHGRETIRRLLLEPAEDCGDGGWRFVPVRAGGQLSVASYRWEGGRWAATAINVLDVRDGLIVVSTGFVDAQLFPRFGLPLELA